MSHGLGHRRHLLLLVRIRLLKIRLLLRMGVLQKGWKNAGATALHLLADNVIL